MKDILRTLAPILMLAAAPAFSADQTSATLDLRFDPARDAWIDQSGRLDPIPLSRAPGGEPFARVPATALPPLAPPLTVEAWFSIAEPTAEGLRALASVWTPLESMSGTFDAFDAGDTDELETRGYLGAVFDGRYVYFSPQQDRTARHGRVMRLDTHLPFKDPAAWQAYDASHTNGLDTRGYYGAAFDGRDVYFVPRYDGSTFHTRVLRYDTRGGFKDSASWTARDAGLPISCQGVGFDGRYLYFCPGYEQAGGPSARVLRYDTRADFHAADSWQVHDATGTDGLNTANFDGAAFDGRYIYFVPLWEADALRYDTRAPFDDPAAWSAFDMTPLGVGRCVGAVFDGRYLYYVPYGETRVVARFDTTADFRDRAAWQGFDASAIGGLATIGYDGGVFDGRYVTFTPFFDGKEFFHGFVLRYDTSGAFTDPASWSSIDASETDGIRTTGFNGGAFDGRYIYHSPWNDGDKHPEAVNGHGRFLRQDTVGDRAAFSLRLADYGHNGGLNAALPGPTFLINTDAGARSVSLHEPLTAGRHHLAGVYDGASLRLIINGREVARGEATGKLLGQDVDLVIGAINPGRGFAAAELERIRIIRGVAGAAGR